MTRAANDLRTPGPADLADAARVCRAVAAGEPCAVKRRRARWLAERLDAFSDDVAAAYGARTAALKAADATVVSARDRGAYEDLACRFLRADEAYGLSDGVHGTDEDLIERLAIAIHGLRRADSDFPGGAGDVWPQAGWRDLLAAQQDWTRSLAASVVYGLIEPDAGPGC